MNGLRNCVLIVDNEFLIVESLRLYLEDMGVEVCGTAATAAAAVALAEEHRPLLVLMDVRLRGERDGVDAAVAIQDSIGSKVIFITGSQEPSMIARMQAAQPVGVLFKPFSGVGLRNAIEPVLAR